MEQEEVGAGEGAGLGGVGGALELREGGQADEGDQGQPVAGRGRRSSTSVSGVAEEIPSVGEEYRRGERRACGRRAGGG